MPSAEITTNLVTVKLEGNEVSASELGNQALALVLKVLEELPAHQRVGFSAGGSADTGRRGSQSIWPPIDSE